MPQLRTLPQPSPTAPHSAFAWVQLLGVQLPLPHWFGPSAPHVWPAGQTPHWRTLPQPSLVAPHSAPAWVQVRGVQEPPH